eukprot:1147323-Prorocentrum_minimum.AAC.1
MASEDREYARNGNQWRQRKGNIGLRDAPAPLGSDRKALLREGPARFEVRPKVTQSDPKVTQK